MTLHPASSRARDQLYPGVPPSHEMTFKVTIGGDSIGVDRFQFRRNGDTLVVERRIRLDVSYLVFYEYRYRHRSREVWQGGRLVELTSRTRDGDESYRVVLSRENGSLVIEQGVGSGTVPEDVLPTSWWHHGILSADRLFDTQKGRLLRVQVEPVQGNPGIRFRSGATMFHRVEGEVELVLAHDSNDELVGLSFQRRGSTILYRRLTRSRD